MSGWKLGKHGRTARLIAALTLGFCLLPSNLSASPTSGYEDCQLGWHRGLSTSNKIIENYVKWRPNYTRPDGLYVYVADVDLGIFEQQLLHLNYLAKRYYLEGNANALADVNGRIAAFYEGALSNPDPKDHPRNHYGIAIFSEGPALHYHQEWEISGKVSVLEKSVSRLTEWLDFWNRLGRPDSPFIGASQILLSQSFVALGVQKGDYRMIERGIAGFEHLRSGRRSDIRTISSRGLGVRFRLRLEHAIAQLTYAQARKEYQAFEGPLADVHQELEAIDPSCNYVDYSRALYYQSYFKSELAKIRGDFETLKSISVTLGKYIVHDDQFPSFRRKIIDLRAGIEETLSRH